MKYGTAPDGQRKFFDFELVRSDALLGRLKPVIVDMPVFLNGKHFGIQWG